MRTGLGVSVAAHVAILAFGIFGLPSTKPYEIAAVDTLPVELVTIADETDLKQGAKDAKEPPAEIPQPKPEALAPTPSPEPTEKPADKPVEAAPPPAPRPEPEPEPEPEAEAEPLPPEPEQVAFLPEPAEPPPPEVEPKPAPEAELAPPAPAQKPRARPKPPKQVQKPKPEPKAAEKSEKSIADLIPKEQAPAKDALALAEAVLLNRQTPSGGGDPDPVDGPQTAGIPTGRVDAAMTQSWVAALSARLAACWGVPNGVREAQTLRVKIGFNLLPDGSVTGYPTILEVNGASNPLSQVAAEAAQRAVMQCGPYGDIFPVEHYVVWQSIEVIFDPREMFGSG